jgi:general stress protein YciG
MAGTKEGSIKAAETNKQRHGDDFYSKIGKRSWQNPERSHVTGFATLPKEKHLEISKKGGQKTKEDYKTNTATEVKELGTSIGE